MALFSSRPSLPRATGNQPGPVSPGSWNKLVKAIETLFTRMETLNPVASSDLGVRVSGSGFTYYLKRRGPLGRRGGRFLVRWDKEQQKLYVTPGAVAWLGAESTEPQKPEIPTLNSAELGTESAFVGAGSLEPDVPYYILLKLEKDACEVQAKKKEPPPGEEDQDKRPALVLATLQLKTEGEEKALDTFTQHWESDLVWQDDGSSSSSDSEGSVGPSDSGSDKSTAIVPAGWAVGGYAALFTEEAPDVRFHDVLRVRLCGRETRVQMDLRYLLVCEKDSIMVQGLVPDVPAAVSATVNGPQIIIRHSTRFGKRPAWAVVHLTGIRRGFKGMRFPSRSREQFEANERFLNSAYPKS